MDYNTNTDRTRRPSNGVLIFCLALLVLFAFSGLFYCLNALRNAEDARQQFEATSFCTGTGLMANESIGCRLDAPMIVTDKWEEYSGGKHNRTYHKLELRTATGDTYTVSVYRHFWSVVSVGQEVGTERWQDNVISVWVGALKSTTGYYPSKDFGFYWFGIWMSIIWLGLCLVGCIKIARGQ